ncbi:MAG TPA: ATP-binding cassette domain-containing protein [Candidatus Aquilonibacter sp.]|nr:ATP-binding cassette domain-containing protein [Candidatus Aquilonibacter sp.]
MHAFTDVNLAVDQGDTLAIVGESGAGKSSLARCVALLERPDGGEICHGGRNVAHLTGRDLLPFRREVQLMFQDSSSALNPRISAAELIAEPLLVQGVGTPARRRERALDLMRAVGLDPESANKRPLEFSGGQRQRIALARALALEPKLLILDEALSSLDVAHQEAMLGLLTDLQAEHSLAYIHISHDLRLVSRFARQVAVMHNGKIVEQSTAEELFARPRHPYTQQLLDAMPPLEVLLLERSA